VRPHIQKENKKIKGGEREKESRLQSLICVHYKQSSTAKMCWAHKCLLETFRQPLQSFKKEI
jgi:hypothetical protein